MYVVSAPHANRDRAISILNTLARDGEHLITGVEVYQEILHRYAAIRRFDAMDSAFQSNSSTSPDTIVDDVLTFGMSEVRAATRLLCFSDGLLVKSFDGLSARDALHVAVMRSAGAGRIVSFDSGFDACPGIERLA